MSDTATCEKCGSFNNVIDPITGLELMTEYDGQMLCSVCRTDARLADNDFSE